MKYRVLFHIGSGLYYTEFFETLDETHTFVIDAYDAGIGVRLIEDEDGEVI